MSGIVALWIVGGLFSLAGALTLAELGAMLPRAGGPYVYLREAYGRLPAFLFGWTEFLVIRSGSVATLAAAFALYAAQPQLFPAPKGMAPRLWQMIRAVMAMSVVGGHQRPRHARQRVGADRRHGAEARGALGAMKILPFVMEEADAANLAPIWPATTGPSFLAGVMAAMVSVLWAYDGWVNASSLAEEIRDPGRNIPRALALGMAILIGVYLSMTLVYHLVLPMDTIKAGSETKGSGHEVAAIFCKTLLGRPGRAGDRPGRRRLDPDRAERERAVRPSRLFRHVPRRPVPAVAQRDPSALQDARQRDHRAGRLVDRADGRRNRLLAGRAEPPRRS